MKCNHSWYPSEYRGYETWYCWHCAEEASIELQVMLEKEKPADPKFDSTAVMNDGVNWDSDTLLSVQREKSNDYWRD